MKLSELRQIIRNILEESIHTDTVLANTETAPPSFDAKKISQNRFYNPPPIEVKERLVIKSLNNNGYKLNDKQIKQLKNFLSAMDQADVLIQPGEKIARDFARLVLNR